MFGDKQLLDTAALDAQLALELPQRTLFCLVSVVITDVASNNTFIVNVHDVNVGNALCASLIASGNFVCKVIAP